MLANQVGSKEAQECDDAECQRREYDSSFVMIGLVRLGSDPKPPIPRSRSRRPRILRRKSSFDPAGTRSVAASRACSDDERRGHGESSPSRTESSRCRSVRRTYHDRLRASTQPRVDCRPAFSRLERGADGVFKRHWLMCQQLVDLTITNNDLVGHRINESTSSCEVDIGDQSQPVRRQSWRQQGHRHNDPSMTHDATDRQHHSPIGERLRTADVVALADHVRFAQNPNQIEQCVGQRNGLGARLNPAWSDHDGQASHQLSENLPTDAPVANDDPGSECRRGHRGP